MKKKILLVEPGYKNKYPPMGLMKLSTYHKQRGDSVVFVKGINKSLVNEFWDRIYITTLFTFDFGSTVETIIAYKYSVHRSINLYVGGILASLMPEKLAHSAGLSLNQINVGQLTDSSKLRFRDHVNIDELPLDYDILETIEYKYPAGDNYISYLTRGCPNHCLFCAVPTLEPEFMITNNIKQQLKAVDERYGPKQNLLLLDNNILNAKDRLEGLVDDLCELGFNRGAKFTPKSPYDIVMKRYHSGEESKLLDSKIVEFLKEFKYKILGEESRTTFISLFIDMEDHQDDLRDFFLTTESVLRPIIEKNYNPRPKIRFVDFNQGVDARLINDENMTQLARLCIRPLRIAFDNIGYKKYYIEAVKTAYRHGIAEISNYLLFNYTDKPVELYQRIKINIELNQELGISIFSFPMKYSPVDETDRKYIGKHWNYKYLRAISAILNVTKGIVAAGDSFFERAFGKSEEEFLELLIMPRDMIMFRSFYESNGMVETWRTLYNQLSEEWKQRLLEFVSRPNNQIIEQEWPTTLKDILPLYLTSQRKLLEESDDWLFKDGTDY